MSVNFTPTPLELKNTVTFQKILSKYKLKIPTKRRVIYKLSVSQKFGLTIYSWIRRFYEE